HGCSSLLSLLLYLLTIEHAPSLSLFFFFFNDPAPTEIYTLSLHDALPISDLRRPAVRFLSDLGPVRPAGPSRQSIVDDNAHRRRSEEHTSELQSRSDLVCRLLLEKKK